MRSYKISFKGGITINWSFEYKPDRLEIKNSLISAILKMSPDELSENIKLTSVEEIVD